jgi:antitoxin MazE
MKAELIKIGNSHGIRIPKPIIEQCGFVKDVELTVRKNCVIISALKSPRDGWDSSFQEMAKHGDDQLLFSDAVASEWDIREWSW